MFVLGEYITASPCMKEIFLPGGGENWIKLNSSVNGFLPSKLIPLDVSFKVSAVIS